MSLEENRCPKRSSILHFKLFVHKYKYWWGTTRWQIMSVQTELITSTFSWKCADGKSKNGKDRACFGGCGRVRTTEVTVQCGEAVDFCAGRQGADLDDESSQHRIKPSGRCCKLQVKETCDPNSHVVIQVIREQSSFNYSLSLSLCVTELETVRWASSLHGVT